MSSKRILTRKWLLQKLSCWLIGSEREYDKVCLNVEWKKPKGQ